MQGQFSFNRLQEVRKQKSTKFLRAIHEGIVDATSRLKSCEAEQIVLLQKADNYLVHRFLGFNSLFQYCVQALGLSEAQAYNYITVARNQEQQTSVSLEEVIMTLANLYVEKKDPVRRAERVNAR